MTENETLNYRQLADRIQNDYEESRRQKGIIVTQAEAYLAISETMRQRGQDIEDTHIRIQSPPLDELYLRCDR